MPLSSIYGLSNPQKAHNPVYCCYVHSGKTEVEVGSTSPLLHFPFSSDNNQSGLQLGCGSHPNLILSSDWHPLSFIYLVLVGLFGCLARTSQTKAMLLLECLLPDCLVPDKGSFKTQKIDVFFCCRLHCGFQKGLSKSNQPGKTTKPTSLSPINLLICSLKKSRGSLFYPTQ